MVLNLKFQEVVDGRDGLAVGGSDDDFAASWDLAELISDLRLLALHEGNAGRNAVVDEHGDIEVTGGERLRDVRQVHADGRAAGVVGGVIDLHANNATI